MNEIIKSDYIHLHCSLATKESLFQAASQWAAEAQIIENAEIFLHGLWDREAEFSTGVGDGIAIPHCRLEAIRRPSVFFVHLEQPICWSPDEQVDLVLVLAVPLSNAENTHIKLLSQLARKLIDETFVGQLRSLDKVSDICTLFNDIQL